MSIDYTRRGPKRPEPVPDVQPEPEPAHGPRLPRRAGERRRDEPGRPQPKPAPKPEPARKRMGDLPAMWLGRVAVALLGLGAVTHQAVGIGWLLLAVAVFSWWRMRQPIRYLLAWVGLVVLRAYVVRKLEPYAADLGPMGSARDPDATWMQVLQSRCGTCGA